MLKNQIRESGLYHAVVNNRLTVVRVDEIDVTNKRTIYRVTNMKTNRKTAFGSAAKFRYEVDVDGKPVEEVNLGTIQKPKIKQTLFDHLPEMKTQCGNCGKECYDKDLNHFKLCESCVAKVDAAFARKDAKVKAIEDGKPQVRTLLGDRINAMKATAAPHVIVKAYAGCGKTTTVIEGLNYMRTGRSKFTPSPQQLAVWESMALSKDAGSFCFVAFNKSIADELGRRVPEGVGAMTMHSMGYKAVRNAWNLLPGKEAINGWKVQSIVADLLGVDLRIFRNNEPEKLAGVDKLVGLCKVNLLDPTVDNLERLESHYEIDLGDSRGWVYEMVPQVIEECLDVDKYKYIDFNDMIWLPVIHNLNLTKYGLLVGDEIQDWNKCQQELAIRSCRRLMGVGDKKQAIYGFAGADSKSMDNLYARLNAMDGGCVELPLTVTRRCSRAVVDSVKDLVPNFEAHESNSDGAVYEASMSPGPDDYRKKVKPGDMIICRVNAPLVSECFRFLKAGVRAQIQGRDIGAGIIALIKKMDPASVNDLIVGLENWYYSEVEKENKKKFPSDSKLISLQDKYECLCCFCEGQRTVQAVIDKIESIFTDHKDSRSILLSSGHKSKGLEADNVFILFPKGVSCPHPMAKSAWQKDQEYNLLYVMKTRAKHILTIVTEEDDDDDTFRDNMLPEKFR